MSKFYAQINSSNIVVAVTQTHSEIIAPHMIELPRYDASVLNNLYNPTDGSFTPQATLIRIITTQAFYRRMTQGERTSMRASSPDVADLREDLERSPSVDLDGTIEAQLLAVGGFDQTRVDELLVNGTEAEL